MKILIATEKPFAKVASEGMINILKEAGFEVTLLEKYSTRAQLLAAVADVEGIIIRSDIIDKEVIDAAPNLKIVVRAGAGYDNVDLEAATSRKVVVMNTPGQNSNAVAELVFCMILYSARNFLTPQSGTELKGKHIGVVAFGNVGRIVAFIAKGFNMSVSAFDAYCSKETIEAAGVVSAESLDEIFENSDYISLHLPATKETRKSINYSLLSKLRQGATIINTARKEIIDEDALIKIMEERPDVRYFTDIKPDCDALLADKYATRYFATAKKMGAQTFEANVNAGMAAAKQVAEFLNNGINLFQVN